jgi:hypothetical protein
MKPPFFFASILTLVLPTTILGQNTPAAGTAKPFCDKDSRFEVRTFCKDLDRFQKDVNTAKAKAKDKELDPDDFKSDLNHLDLQSPDSRSSLVTVLGPKATAKQAFKVVSSAAKSVTSDAASASSQQRIDQQLSPSSTASGTTSLVSKAGSAQLLSLGLDTGALTRSVNGTTVTLTTNADQVFRLITNDDPDCTVTCVDSGWFHKRILSPVTLSASLDLAQRGTTTTPTNGQASGTTSTPISAATIPTGAGKLSSFTARYEVANQFDPRSAKFKQNWDNESKKYGLGPLSDNVKTATDAMKNSLKANAPELVRKDILQVAESDPSGQALTDFFYKYVWAGAQTILQNDDIQTAVGKIMQNRALYRQAWFETLRDAAGTMFTFEYNYNRPLNQPLTHDFKIVYGYDFGDRGMVTANGSVSIYDTIPAAANYGRLHYGQASFEYDRNLRASDRSMQTQITLAGYWQYQPHPSILDIPAGTVAPGTTIPLPNGTQEFVGTAGSLWVTQAKITIKGTGGINIPIGVSWSNKTDLLQGSRVGAQVGISYNFSSIAGIFTGAQ